VLEEVEHFLCLKRIFCILSRIPLRIRE
jgi:hypothetical protein